LRLSSKKRESEEGKTDMMSEASCQLHVSPLDAKGLGKIIDDCGARMLANVHRSGADEPMKLLGAIRDERVIPYFVKALKTSDYSMKFNALEAFSKYKNDAALNGLGEGLKTSATDFPEDATTIGDQLAENIRFAAVCCLSKSPHPAALSLLLAQQDNTCSDVRMEMVRALGTKVHAKEAIPQLMKMTKDSNKDVAGAAKYYLEQLWRSSTVRPATFD
jgi:HEAT repeat protein